MSGGSLDYAYNDLEDAMHLLASKATRIEHRAFIGHLKKVTKALRDIEWTLSGDNAEGSEIAAIMAVISPVAVKEQATAELVKAVQQAQSILSKDSKCNASEELVKVEKAKKGKEAMKARRRRFDTLSWD